MKKRIIALFLCLGLCLGMAGCGDAKGMRLDLAAGVASLDPQFTTNESDRMILKNIMEGLLVRRADGSLELGAAADYTVSPDGLTYTFTLREGLLWEDSSPVTAADFQYAMRRLFDPDVPSPFAEEYLALLNAPEILAGELPATHLGVEAPDETTLIFRLSEPSPLFLERLADCAAMPCRQEFFESTRARYGLGLSYILGNGPFNITGWNNDSAVVLTRSETYWDAQAVQLPSATFYLGREDPKGEFLDGKSDCCQLSYEDLERLDAKKFSYEARENTLWTLTFNQTAQRQGLDDVRVRRALVGALDLSGVPQRVSDRYAVVDSLVVSDAVLFQEHYEDRISAPARNIGYHPQEAKAWLDEYRGAEGEVSGLTLILPQSADLAALGGYFQKLWKDHLLLYVNLEILPDSEYRSRLTSGDYTLALVSMASTAEGPQGTLASHFTAGSANVSRFSDGEYDQLLSRALTAGQASTAAECYRQAEEYLLQNAVALPLFTESSYYAVGKGVSGVEFEENGGVYLKNASRT